MKTQTYHLYHRHVLWLPFRRPIEEPLDPNFVGWPHRYRHVADLQAQSLEAVYALSQHLEQAWWLKPGVILHEESRSTSVGDVLVDAVGAAWAVAPLGFAQLASNGDPTGPDVGAEELHQKNETACSSQKNKPKGDQDVPH